MPAKLDEYLARNDSLDSIARNWEDHWQRASELVLPRRSDFTVTHAKGEVRRLQAVDTTAILANELLAAGMHGMMTNPASKWFTLKITEEEFNEQGIVKEWLEKVALRIFAEMNGPNAAFSTHVHEFYLDLTGFGTAVMFIGSNDITGDLSFSARSLAECRIAENSDGRADTVYRKFQFNARQIFQKWGKKSGKTVLDAYEKKQFDKSFKILHAVQPRADFNRNKKTRANMPIASVYINLDDRHIIEEGGFHENPYIAARWMKVAGETYGRGPGLDTLPDTMMLQEVVKTVLKAAQKAVDPPLQVPDDGFINPVRTVPGGLNFRRPGADKIEVFPTSNKLNIGLELIQSIQTRIREGFFIDQLQLQQGPQMTATEVLQRTEEKLRLLGPVLGRLQAEMLGPMIQRVFGILARAGRLPEPPPELEGVDYEIEYVSPLARAQKQVEANSLLRVFEIGGPILQISPQSADVINGDKTLRWLADLFGLPSTLQNSEEAVTQKRQEQAQREQQAAALQAADVGAGALEKMSKAARA